MKNLHITRLPTLVNVDKLTHACCAIAPFNKKGLATLLKELKAKRGRK